MRGKPGSRRPAEVGAGSEPEADVSRTERAQHALPLSLDAPADPEPVRSPAADAGASERVAGGDADVAPARHAPVDPAVQLAEYRRRVLADGTDVPARRHLARLLAAK